MKHPTLRAASAWLAAGLVVALVAALAGCGTSPPTHLYELRPDPPAQAEPLAPPLPHQPVWELAPAVGLPPALDRDTLMLASGQAGLRPWAGQRWAAPLRDAVPRLLLLDLQRLRGADRVWPAPAPPGVAPEQRLRVELETLQASLERRQVLLQARWVWQPPGPGAAAPRTDSVVLVQPLADASADGVAAAHRVLLWRLAQHIAAHGPPAAVPTGAGLPSLSGHDGASPPATSGEGFP